uniref:Uncharacterized protein n=1 Tax=Timema bartmani TaxID=61472 RepID=A0A7R9ET30_9NEOP|nr:unnamed protein product [Timema bartmani]
MAAANNTRVQSAPWFHQAQINSLQGTKFSSFAKASHFHKDLYADWVAATLETDLVVESWTNGVGPLPSECSKQFKVENIESVNVKVAAANFSSHLDHSKWALSVDNHTKSWVCVGDINRMAVTLPDTLLIQTTSSGSSEPRVLGLSSVVTVNLVRLSIHKLSQFFHEHSQVDSWEEFVPQGGDCDNDVEVVTVPSVDVVVIANRNSGSDIGVIVESEVGSTTKTVECVGGQRAHANFVDTQVEWMKACKISLLLQQNVQKQIQWGASLPEHVAGAQGGRIHGATMVLPFSDLEPSTFDKRVVLSQRSDYLESFRGQALGPGPPELAEFWECFWTRGPAVVLDHPWLLDILTRFGPLREYLLCVLKA